MITQTDYNTVWDAFDSKYNFSADYYGPGIGIIEPQPSMTVHWDKFEEKDIARLTQVFKDAFTSIGAATIYGLDWQHPSYEIDVMDMDKSPITVYPDGDYYILCTKDFANGTFGHPWRQTICVFGDKILPHIIGKMPKSFNSIIRIDGKSV